MNDNSQQDNITSKPTIFDKKAYDRAYSAKYRAEKSAKYKESQKNIYTLNKSKRLAYSKAYYQKNKERIAQQRISKLYGHITS